MVTEVVLPMLGISVENGKIIQWLKDEGDHVEKGEAIFTVESEKVTTDVEAPASGILAKILIPAGVTSPLMTVVGIITEPGEKVPDKYLEGSQAAIKATTPADETAAPAAESEISEPAPAAPGGRPRIVPAARKLAKEKGIDPAQVKGTGPDGVITVGDIKAFKPATEAVKASTLARRLAEKEAVDLSAVQGTGIRGRIMRSDVQAARETDRKSGPDLGDVIPMTGIRQVIAKRMSASAFTAPHTYFFAEVEMDALLAYRSRVLSDFEHHFGLRPSVNDFLIKAVALNIYDFPLFNAQIEGDDIHIMPEINVGLAVAQPTGLIVPAIKDADRIGLVEIARQRMDLTARARDGKLTMDEIQRGTFTISSLAQYNITHFTAIINPPQSAILSVAKTDDKLVMVDGQVQVKKVSTLGISADHRVVDGAQVADFLQNLKQKLECPEFTFMHL